MQNTNTTNRNPALHAVLESEILTPADNIPPYVQWFRNSAPYINTHRGKTFVIMFNGEAVTHPNFSNLIHDFALLHSLGINLVLVHGARPQIEQNLAENHITTPMVNFLRVTPKSAMPYILEAAGSIRIQIEV